MVRDQLESPPLPDWHGLSQFWSSLDAHQHNALVTITRDSLVDMVPCAGCKELMTAAFKDLDEEAAFVVKEAAKEAHTIGGSNALVPGAAGGAEKNLGTVLLRHLVKEDRFVCVGGVTPEGQAPPPSTLDFAHYQGFLGNSASDRGSSSTTPPTAGQGQFRILPSYLKTTISILDELGRTSPASLTVPMPSMMPPMPPPLAQSYPSSSSSSSNAKAASTAGAIPSMFPTAPAIAPAPGSPAPACLYCADKFNLKFVDTLTYPRPARTFRLLVDKAMPLFKLREMMAAETGLDHVGTLVLLHRGVPLPREKDNMTLEQLKMKDGQMVAISRVLGGAEEVVAGGEEEVGAENRNKQFVGDLLFGTSIAAGGAPAAGEKPRNPVQTLKAVDGCQVLGKALSNHLRLRVILAWQADVKARISEAELLASLQEEENSAGGEGRKAKANRKKKEKDKQRKLEVARKQQEEEQARRAEQEERQKIAKQKQEEARKAKAAEAERQRLIEEQAWREREELKQKQQEALQQRQEAERKAAAEQAREEKEKKDKEKKAKKSKQQSQQQQQQSAQQPAAASAQQSSQHSEKVRQRDQQREQASRDREPPAPVSQGATMSSVSHANEQKAPPAAQAQQPSSTSTNQQAVSRREPRQPPAPTHQNVVALVPPPVQVPPPSAVHTPAPAQHVAPPPQQVHAPPAPVTVPINTGGSVASSPSFCSSCGERVAVAGANFCAFCGARLAPVVSTRTAPPTQQASSPALPVHQAPVALSAGASHAASVAQPPLQQSPPPPGLMNSVLPGPWPALGGSNAPLSRVDTSGSASGVRSRPAPVGKPSTNTPVGGLPSSAAAVGSSVPTSAPAPAPLPPFMGFSFLSGGDSSSSSSAGQVAPRSRNSLQSMLYDPMEGLNPQNFLDANFLDGIGVGATFRNLNLGGSAEGSVIPQHLETLGGTPTSSLPRSPFGVIGGTSVPQGVNGPGVIARQQSAPTGSFLSQLREGGSYSQQQQTAASAGAGVDELMRRWALDNHTS